MVEHVTILPSSRAIRAQILSNSSQDAFQSRYITMGEFLQRSLVCEGYTRVDDDTRILLLLEASDFSNFANLQIERNFFTFTQNSSYLFRFFEELSGELIDIGTLEFADTYGDYEEHIEILKELYRRYREICMDRKILDPVFIPELTRLNESYVKSLGSVEIVAEGYITNFELRTLMECARIIPLKMRFYANTFNIKMQEKLRALGIDVVESKIQIIDLTDMRVAKSGPVRSECEISCESFGERLLQVAFIKQKVFEFIEAGIEPEKIAVVLPDEGFADHLRRFDSENNFNFAMGHSLAESRFVKAIEAAMAYLDNQTVQNSSRLNRLGTEVLEAIRKQYSAKVSGLDVPALINSWIEAEEDAKIKEIVIEELFYFEKILPYLQESTLKSALYLFVNRVKSRTIDDVRGGKVTVMGVLETRSVRYDGVIVIDFNEGVVPRKSEKDLFLNSATRMKAGLPSATDREALQKLYYNNLFLRAKKVAISYVESSDSVPSRFMTQLGLHADKGYSDAQWADILFNREERKPYETGEIEAAYDFTSRPLSATGLKTYLTCKRKFYHRYVDGLKDHEIAKDMPEEHEIGTALHNALRDVYEKQGRFSDINALRSAVDETLRFHNGKTALDHYLHNLWMRRLEPFFNAEIERFKEAEVIACESSLSAEVRGIKLTGQIDRIDRTLDGLEVLDYKSGKFATYTPRTVEKATDFQLEFYYLLAQQKGEVARCGYYDLKTGEIADETLLESKLELLYGHLQELREATTTNFEKTDSINDCRFCEFAHICGRSL
ncbi:MAG: PD-(D/E)XK nuclease family protein [Sulfurimonadaceae bacterium]|nr:PD-(D/E)XK nuclease family protein [Sulfurimonadaceae bacterium]